MWLAHSTLAPTRLGLRHLSTTKDGPVANTQSCSNHVAITLVYQALGSGNQLVQQLCSVLYLATVYSCATKFSQHTPTMATTRSSAAQQPPHQLSLAEIRALPAEVLRLRLAQYNLVTTGSKDTLSKRLQDSLNLAPERPAASRTCTTISETRKRVKTPKLHRVQQWQSRTRAPTPARRPPMRDRSSTSASSPESSDASSEDDQTPATHCHRPHLLVGGLEYLPGRSPGYPPTHGTRADQIPVNRQLPLRCLPSRGLRSYDQPFRQCTTRDPTLRWDILKDDIIVWTLTPAVQVRRRPPPDPPSRQSPFRGLAPQPALGDHAPVSVSPIHHLAKRYASVTTTVAARSPTRAPLPTPAGPLAVAAPTQPSPAPKRTSA